MRESGTDRSEPSEVIVRDDAGARRYSNSYLLIVLFCTVYSIVGIFLFLRMGLLQNLPEVTFSTVDSGVYLEVASSIAGRTEVDPRAILRRPLLYPIFLLMSHEVGPWGVFVLQWCFNLTTLLTIFLSIRYLTKSSALAYGGIFLTAIHPTFSFISLHAVTESLSFALISAVVYCLVLFFSSYRIRTLALSSFFLSAATCVKPAYLPFLVLWLIYAVYALCRYRLLRLRSIWLIPLALSPLILQFGMTFALTGQSSIATSGRMNFMARYFPAVYGFETKGSFISFRDPEAQVAREEYPSVPSRAKFVLTHPRATFLATAYLLRTNLTSPSLYTQIPIKLVAGKPLRDVLTRFSERLNIVLAPVHAAGLLAVFWLLVSASGERKTLLFLLETLVCSILLSSVLTYGQGDRLILAGLPAWVVLYAEVIRQLANSGTMRTLGRRSRTSLE